MGCRLTDKQKTKENILELFHYEMEQLENNKNEKESVELLEFCINELEQYEEEVPVHRIAKNYCNVKTCYKKRKRRQVLLKSLKKVSVAACFCMLVLSVGQVVSKANGFDFFQYSVDNIKENIHISHSKKSLSSMFSMDFKPEWVPEGFSLFEENEQLMLGRKVYAYQNNKEQYILFTVYRYAGNGKEVLLETDGNVTEESYNGQTYYLGSNRAYNLISWYDDEKMQYYEVSTSLPKEDLLELLKNNLNY